MSTNKMPEQYSLKWNNFHTNLTTGFHGLFEDEDLVDVSLAVEGKIIQAHKVILSVCSPYFKSLFRIHPEKHPIVFLKDVGYSEVIGLLQFMYQGQVDVSQEQLAEFLRVAEMLQVKGLTSNSESDNSNNSITPDIVDPMIPLPVLSALSSLNNNLNGTSNNNNSPSQNALKRKKPSTQAPSNPLDNCEPIFKIVSVESLKKPKLAGTEDASSTSASTNGIGSTIEQDATCDSPSAQMVPKIEPVEEYTESNFGEYADIGENFMSHFMEEPASDSTPQQSQQSYSTFTSETQPQPQAVVSKSSTSTPDNNSSSANTGNGTPVQKLTSQQIMNIDVSLLQDPLSRELSACETAVVISKKLFYQGCYFRREKMTYNKKLMWKCINYSKFKCHCRVHTFEGRIIYSSDNHNHRPHALEDNQSMFLTPPAQAKKKHVYTDGHDFIGRTTALGVEKPARSVTELYANNNTKLSLTKNICYNLQNITKARSNGEGTNGANVNDKTVVEISTNDEFSEKNVDAISSDSEAMPIDLTHVLHSTITEIPNSLGKLTKCAIKQELITCTPEIC